VMFCSIQQMLNKQRTVLGIVAISKYLKEQWSWFPAQDIQRTQKITDSLCWSHQDAQSVCQGPRPI
jgi:hypothetical protein